MKRLIFIFAIVLMSIYPAAAQENPPLSTDELKLIDFVLASYEELFAQTSYTSELQQSMSQEITAGFTTITQDMKQSGSVEAALDPEGGATNLHAISNQRISVDTGDGNPQAMNNDYELIIYDGVMYAKFENAESLGVPRGWFNLQDLPGMEMLNLDQFTELTGANALKVYPINEETVATIEELDSETLEGETMRVIKITWDMAALAEMESMSAIFNAEVFSQMLGIDPAEYMRQFALGSTYEQILWISTTDNLPHRADSRMVSDVTIDAMMGSMEMLYEQTSSATFADFGAPVTIEAPEIGQE